MKKTHAIFLALIVAGGIAGCTNDMKDQPKYKPYRESKFFPDGRSERPLVDGVVARGFLNEDSAFYEGKTADGKLVKTIPVPLTAELVKRGQERFNIYCIVCHGASGAGDGMIIKRGFKPLPPTFHSDRLRDIEDGHFFDVITHGFGMMQDYSMQIQPADRWAIVAYIRALQLSQNAPVAELPAADQQKLGKKV